jgi:hypothetical protein
LLDLSCRTAEEIDMPMRTNVTYTRLDGTPDFAVWGVALEAGRYSDILIEEGRCLGEAANDPEIAAGGVTISMMTNQATVEFDAAQAADIAVTILRAVDPSRLSKLWRATGEENLQQ